MCPKIKEITKVKETETEVKETAEIKEVVVKEDKSLFLLKAKKKTIKSKITTSWRFDEELLNKFRDDCKKEGVSMNKIVVALLKRYLNL